MEHVIEVGSEAGLYAAYRTDLVRFATALVGSADAADVVSDAVLSLLKSGQLGDADQPKALMYRAVTARANSMHRSVFRRRSRERRFAQSVMVEDPELRPDVVEAVIGRGHGRNSALRPVGRRVGAAFFRDDSDGAVLGYAQGIEEPRATAANDQEVEFVGGRHPNDSPIQ